MKQNWIYKKLGEICDVKTGKLDANASDENGLYPFFTCSKEPLHINTFSYDAECILVAGNGDLNVKYYNGKFDAYQRTYIITLKHSVTNISVKYLFCFFLLYVDALREKSIGGVIKYIKLGDITEAIVPVPPLADQSRIVAELDLLQSVIDKKKAQLDEYDKLAQSIFYEMFGDPIDNPKKWEVKKLGEIGECISGGTPSRKRTDYFSGNINWFSAGELNSLFLTDSVEKITQEALDSSAAKLCKPMSLFIGMYDTAAFKLGIPTIESTSNQACANVSLYQDNIIWLYYVLLLMKDEALKHRHGARQKNLNLNYIKNFEIPLPPLSLQQSFAEKIEAIEHQKELVKQSLNEVKTLFDSRMDYYFN